jgi:hypothetical protein
MREGNEEKERAAYSIARRSMRVDPVAHIGSRPYHKVKNMLVVCSREQGQTVIPHRANSVLWNSLTY